VSELSNLYASRPLIGVTVGNRRGAVPRLAVNSAYVNGVHAAGADVVLLPPSPNGVAPALLDRLDGILLPGGADVSPASYGERPREGLEEVDDDLDLLLVHDAVDRRLPLFGICRGHQVVNVALGGTLYQDLACDGATTVRHATPQERGRDHLAHPIEVESGSRLRDVLGAGTVLVNSFHHQAVRRLAPGLMVTARNPGDGIVEGLESPDGLILTVQCHPEELTAGHAWARALFSALVTAAAERSRAPVG
jgi:gamma-glutamyl-gamma-aminobutyrate hydrolase PuuD